MIASRKCIHLVSFDVPFPADYGGVIDVYFKLRALHRAGVKVWLHCFSYGREERKELEEICEKVFYYKRRMYGNPILLKKPYIVASREHEDLLQNLRLNDWPILFEGLHTTAFLGHAELSRRFKMVRTHNVEHHYYSHLEAVERNYFKKYFFRIESEKLKRYQNVLKYAQCIFPISPDDTAYFSKRWKDTVHQLPPFHANERVEVKPGKGTYALYHGNLGVGENNEAALFLIHEVFSKLEVPFVIAGNKPSAELVRAAAAHSHISLKSGISTSEIDALIADAQVNVLYTAQATGIKLKLINVLYRGRYCVANDKMVSGTGLESLCRVADTPEGIAREVKLCFDKPFQPALLKLRQTSLTFYHCAQSVKIITSLI